ncbi:hypothetical protein EXIGLDRAFT_524402 [Exidia glandulosa HHB12029]|uniref:Uncharacterized protein n=1 Tax=Exidia glandulosa HHB12029 TaxID=1314781 RepID=A0A165J1L4_EXIGL|nr:hypothetical protein EXIGLDRAFT_524402 [Exidia glandulosa HHB12029]
MQTATRPNTCHQSAVDCPRPWSILGGQDRTSSGINRGPGLKPSIQNFILRTQAARTRTVPRGCTGCADQASRRPGRITRDDRGRHKLLGRAKRVEPNIEQLNLHCNTAIMFEREESQTSWFVRRSVAYAESGSRQPENQANYVLIHVRGNQKVILCYNYGTDGHPDAVCTYK